MLHRIYLYKNGPKDSKGEVCFMCLQMLQLYLCMYQKNNTKHKLNNNKSVNIVKG